jgi:AF2212-like
MEKTLTVVFDGTVFRPAEPVDLEPNTSCVITIVSHTSPPCKIEDAWDVLDQMTGTIDGPEDWSTEHDHYLYGTPKRHDGPKVA